MKALVFVVLLAALALGSVCVAQDSFGATKGSREISFMGAYCHVGDTDVTALGLTYAFYTTPNLEWGVGYGGLWVDVDGESSSFSVFALSAQYHFLPQNGGPNVPYVGARWMTGTGDVGNFVDVSDDTVTGYGFNVGVKHYLSQNNYLFLDASWNRLSWAHEHEDATLIGFGLGRLY
jgi:outer membrane protein W